MTCETGTSMASAAECLLASLPPGGRSAAQLPYDPDSVRRISFRPHPRPGIRLGDAPRAARTSIYQLLDLALSAHGFALVLSIMGMEAMVSRASDWRKDQHSDDYYTVVHGRPGEDDHWSWRFEGHHVSLTATVHRGSVTVAPVFLGASPDRVVRGGRTLLHPLAAESQLAREALEDMGADWRASACVSRTAPREISYGSAPVVGPLEASGVRVSALPSAARHSLEELADTYLERVAPGVAGGRGKLLSEAGLTFAWRGGRRLGEEFHYLLRAGEVFVAEYGDNSHGRQTANHVHSILRLPQQEFGGDHTRSEVRDDDALR